MKPRAEPAPEAVPLKLSQGDEGVGPALPAHSRWRTLGPFLVVRLGSLADSVSTLMCQASVCRQTEVSGLQCTLGPLIGPVELLCLRQPGLSRHQLEVYRLLWAMAVLCGLVYALTWSYIAFTTLGTNPAQRWSALGPWTRGGMWASSAAFLASVSIAGAWMAWDCPPALAALGVADVLFFGALAWMYRKSCSTASAAVAASGEAASKEDWLP